MNIKSVLGAVSYVSVGSSAIILGLIYKLHYNIYQITKKEKEERQLELPINYKYYK